MFTPQPMFSYLLSLAILKVACGVRTSCYKEEIKLNGLTPCFNALRQQAKIMGLFERLPSNTYELPMLDRNIDVHYTAPPGVSSACDHTYQTSESLTFDLDPLNPAVLQATQTRMMPEISWEAQDDELFTLLMVYFHHGGLKLAVANIQNNNIEEGLDLIEFDPPHHPVDGYGNFTFMLYKQNSPIDGHNLTLENRFHYNKTQFELKYKLIGPVAITWMTLVSDINDTLTPLAKYNQNHCGELVRKELIKNKPNLPFLSMPLQLEIYLRVRFTSGPFTFKCGPFSITHPAKDFYLNPIGNPIIDVADIRTGSTLTFDVKNYTIYDKDFESIDAVRGYPYFHDDLSWLQGKLYTMLIVDSDVGILHGLTINIPGEDFTAGTSVVPYRQPMPPVTHTYYFLLYEQVTSISTESLHEFWRDGMGCRFYCGVQAFLTKHSLRLVGASWMRATNDDFVKCSRQNKEKSSY